jgi:hypothetical protein
VQLIVGVDFAHEFVNFAVVKGFAFVVLPLPEFFATVFAFFGAIIAVAVGNFSATTMAVAVGGGFVI